MANIAGSYSSNSSYYPQFTYAIDYWETGRSATAVTYRFSVSYTRTNNWYGYDIIVNWNIGGVTSSKTILAANANLASGSITFDVTCSTDANGGTLSARIWTTSTTDSTHYQNAIDTGSQTVNRSTFNTAPVISGNVTAAGTTGNAYIAENASSIAVSWPAATDVNNNLSGYRLRVSINGAAYTELTRTTSRTYSHNVSGYSEGTTFKYVVDAYDSYSSWSANIYSGVITKNTLTASTITTSSSIGFLSANGTVTFTVAGGSNTSGAAISTRVLTCNKVTVYNGSISTGTITLTVYVSGTLPTGPYIKFADLKTAFSGSSYQGSLIFTLTTNNSYGLSKTNTTTMSVDLRTNPNAATSCTIVTGAASTAYKTITATGNSYFIPDTGRVIRVTWAGGSGKLGESITYSLYVAYGSGSWQLVTSGLASTVTYYDHAVPRQTVSQTIKYMIRVITPYNYYTDLASTAQNLHYYNAPTVTPGTLTRAATTCNVVVTVKSNSSIPNINTVGTWVCNLSTTAVSSGTLTVSQAAQTIAVTGLTDNNTYSLVITYNDNTGFSTNNTHTITIGVNTPIVFVNKYGLGIGGAKADSNYKLNVTGATQLTNQGDGAVLAYLNIERAWKIKQGGTGAAASLDIQTITDSKNLRLVSANGTPRARFTINDTATCEFVIDGTITINGTNALMFGNGGGWNMTDTTWIRSYGSKSVYINSLCRADGGLQVGTNGAYFNVSTAGAITCASTITSTGAISTSGSVTANGNFVLGASASDYGRLGFDATSTDVYIANNANNWLRLKTDQTMTYAGYKVYTTKEHGNIPYDYTRITNLNVDLINGWYSYSSGATGAPASYGVLLVMHFGTSDFCQISIDTGNNLQTRWYVNNAWTSWIGH